MALIGLPYLPGNKQGFFIWLARNLAKAWEMQIRIDLFVLLYAEAWPCSWNSMLEFWGSELLTDSNLKGMIIRRHHLSPAVKTFVKAGCSGICILKKCTLVHP